MADSTEHIEARLCAYIDGELSEAERAEIENHLKSNPQHRQLIEELVQTRALLRSLPRASAPPDITDVLQAQLERSLLLDDTPAGPGDGVLRIRRWPQVVAIAAIVLLVVGVGSVLYQLLQMPESDSLALHQPTATDKQLAEDADGDLLEGGSTFRDAAAGDQANATGRAFSAEAAPRERELAGVAGPDVEALPAGPFPEVAAVPADAARSELNMKADPYPAEVRENLVAVLSQPQVRMELESQLADSGNRRVYMVISTDRPDLANSEITRYFESQQLFSNAQASHPLAQLGVRELPEQQQAQADPQTGEQRDPPGRAMAEPQAEQSRVQSMWQSRGTQIAQDGWEARQQQQAAISQQRESANLAQAPAAQQPVEIVQQPLRGLDDGAGAGINNLVVVRNASRRQADELRLNLANQRAIQQAIVVEDEAVRPMTPSRQPQIAMRDRQAMDGGEASALMAAPTTATTLPAAPLTGGATRPAPAEDLAANEAPRPDVIAPNDVLHITIIKPNADDPDDRVRLVQVDQDGQIALPQIGRVNAAGQSVDELREKIVSVYANAEIEVDVQVRKLSLPGGERPIAGADTGQGAFRIDVPPQPPARRSFESTTRPQDALAEATELQASPAEAPDDQAVDLVIVVQAEPAAAATPTSQPSAPNADAAQEPE